MTPVILWLSLVVSDFLRRFLPHLRIGKHVVVTRYADVVDILARDHGFTISEINGPTVEALSGPFILAQDCPEYSKDVVVLQRAVRRGDPARIEQLVNVSARDQVDAARKSGRIDVIADLADVVSVRLVNEYFGVPSPPSPHHSPHENDETLRQWMRVLFSGVFLNLGNNKTIHDEAVQVSEKLKEYLNGIIQDGTPNDDFLGRLIELSDDADWVRRNITGMIIGALVTTSKTVGLIVDQLLRRPLARNAASKAAKAGDMEGLRQICYEALRFNPLTPITMRRCDHDTVVGEGLGRFRIKAGATVYAVILSAMMDPSNFPDPKRFSANRPRSHYLHFGHGLHSCFGEYINQISIPRIIAPLMQLENLERAPGRAGTLQFEGSYPRSMVLWFGP